METRTVMQREMEEQSTQMSHSMQLSSQIKKKTFKSRCTHTLELGEMIGKQKSNVGGKDLASFVIFKMIF